MLVNKALKNQYKWITVVQYAWKQLLKKPVYRVNTVSVKIAFYNGFKRLQNVLYADNILHFINVKARKLKYLKKIMK
jgi:hypothetical protein